MTSDSPLRVKRAGTAMDVLVTLYLSAEVVNLTRTCIRAMRGVSSTLSASHLPYNPPQRSRCHRPRTPSLVLLFRAPVFRQLTSARVEQSRKWKLADCAAWRPPMLLELLLMIS